MNGASEAGVTGGIRAASGGIAASVLLNGCNGAMGQVFSRVAARHGDIAIAAGVDVSGEAGNTAGNAPGNPAGGSAGGRAYPAYIAARGDEAAAFAAIKEAYGVILDFSHPSALGGILELAKSKKIPVVLAATGYSERQTAEIRDASESVPVFRSANMSVGVNLMTELVRLAARAIGGGFDIEIVEKHHNQKLDAPSGTAHMLAEAIKSELSGDISYVYDRHAERKKRGKSEIGIHTVRGGTIVGEHVAIFAGPDEVLEIRHAASSKEIFAEGAVRAVRYMSSVGSAGMYDMRDVLAGAKA
jgi:4-hydroxy-tetrahydrodipicolinate reductase